MVKYIFDLDGTISKEETLPRIASYFHIEEQIEELTKQTVLGNIPFMDSFIKRVHLLSCLPVSDVNRLLENIELFFGVMEFISCKKEDCIIATGNLGCWVEKLVKRIDIKSYTSSAIVENDRICKICKILQKEDVVKEYKQNGEFIVFIGEGNNDVEAMRLADVSIASGLVHMPATSVLTVADYLVFEESTLCRLLNQLSYAVPV